MFNVTEAVNAAGGAFTNIGTTFNDASKGFMYGIRLLGDTVGDSEVAEGLIQYFDVSWFGTILTCGGMSWNYHFGFDWYTLKGLFKVNSTFQCALGTTILLMQGLVAMTNLGYPGVSPLGTLEVDGLGNVLDIYQLNRLGTMKLGFLAPEHEYGLPVDCLAPAGFNSTKTYAVFDDTSSTVNVSFGVEAHNRAGYDLMCYSTELKPQDMVALIVTTEPGDEFNSTDHPLLCLSYYPGNAKIEGAILSEKGKSISVPLAKKMELTKPVRASSIEEIDGEEENAKALKEMLDEFDAGMEDLKNEYELGLTFQKVESATVKTFGAAFVYTGADGKKRTALGSNYLNSYGPPKDYLASI